MAPSGMRCLALLLGLTAGGADAATFRASNQAGDKVIISLDGDIAEGDTDKLKGLIKEANDKGRRVSAIRLNSPGGNLPEGALLALLVKYAKTATSVVNGATCASACFIVFAAGAEKYVSHTALVGVHGASEKSGEETTQSRSATVAMARIIKELGVPPAVIGKMVVTPPDEIVWLSSDELRLMGTVMTGKPAQIAQEGANNPVQLRPQVPSVSPQVQARSTSNERLPSWSEITDRMISASKAQNNGKARTSRICEPEKRLCSTAVFARGKDGTELMVRIIENSDGKVVRREMCDFNQFVDVRNCVDWDANTISKDMKRGSGEWVRVSNDK